MPQLSPWTKVWKVAIYHDCRFGDKGVNPGWAATGVQSHPGLNQGVSGLQ